MRCPDRSRPTDEDGFALLVALVALVALTALATGGIYVASSDFQSTDAFGKGHRAFYTADAALQEFVGTYGATPPATASYDFGNGEEATVTAELVSREPNVYRIEAAGVVVVGSDTVATRTVGTAAAVNMGPLPEPPGNMFSPNGITKKGASGTISGYDTFDSDSTAQCPYGEPRDTNGIVVSDSVGYEQSGSDLIPKGDPNDVLEKDQDQMLSDLNLDWESVVNGESIEPDVTVDPDDMSNWPDFDTIPDDQWPVIYAEGKDKTLTLDAGRSGHGLLITRGGLSMNGSFSWKGAMYVGGGLTAGNGDQTITGAMLSGLNLLLGEDIDSGADVLDGTKTFEFNSCWVQQARSATSRLEVVRGSWYQGEDES